MPRIAPITFFGMKWYPMTLKPAVPYAISFAGWYYLMSSVDASVKAKGKGFQCGLDFNFSCRGTSLNIPTAITLKIKTIQFIHKFVSFLLFYCVC